MDPDATGLLIVDMINDYLAPEGALSIEANRSVVPRVREALSACREAGMPVFFVGSSLRDPTQPMAKKWGMHAAAGTWGAEVIEELTPREDEPVVEKPGYDGFYGTDLDQLLRTRDIDTVLLAGVDTHVCVLQTAAGAFNHGYEVVVLEDGVTTRSEQSHDFGIEYIESHFGSASTIAGLQEDLGAHG